MDYLAKLGMNRTITRDKDDPSVAVVYWRNEKVCLKERLYNATAFLDAAEEAGILGKELVIVEVEEPPESPPEPVEVAESPPEPGGENGPEDGDEAPSEGDILDALLGASEPEFTAMAEEIAASEGVNEEPLTDDLTDIGDDDGDDDDELPGTFDNVIPISDPGTDSGTDVYATVTDDAADAGDAIDALPEFDISDLETDEDEDADMIDDIGNTEDGNTEDDE